VENGVIAFTTLGDNNVFVGRSAADADELADFSDGGPLNGAVATGSFNTVWLSPTGDWLSIGAVEIEAAGDGSDEFSLVGMTAYVYDVATGERTALDIPGDPPVVIANRWLDEHTLQVLATNAFAAPPSERAADWYTCTVPGGSCERVDVQVDLGESGANGGFPVVLPDGRVAG
jgi:hypothetical protein